LIITAEQWRGSVPALRPLLSVSLPPDLQLDCSSVAFVARGELILMTERKQMACWEIASEAHFRISAMDRE